MTFQVNDGCWVWNIASNERSKNIEKTNGLVEFRRMKAAEDSFQQVSGPWQRCDSPARRHSLEPVPDNFFFLSSGHLPAETNLQNTRGLAA